jgi:hypothetical protein
VPLDFLISTKVNFKKKFEKKMKSKDAPENCEPVHERDFEAAEQGIILIDEYKFPHCVY